jgi:hypothetical protein
MRITRRLITNEAKQVVGNYGEFAKMCDGCTCQTQRFVKGGQFRRVVDAIVNQYRDAGILGERGLLPVLPLAPVVSTTE